MAINQPCKCEVKPQFSGDLVFASNVVLYDCFTEVTIRKNAQNDDIFAVRCPRTHSSKMYSVTNSSVFEISSTYLRRTGDTSFHQSIQIFQGIICIKNKTALKTRLFCTTKQIGFWICYVLRICFHLVCLHLNVFKYKWFFFRYFIEFI